MLLSFACLAFVSLLKPLVRSGGDRRPADVELLVLRYASRCAGRLNRSLRNGRIAAIHAITEPMLAVSPQASVPMYVRKLASPRLGDCQRKGDARYSTRVCV